MHIPDYTAVKVTKMAVDFARTEYNTFLSPEQELIGKLHKFIRERYENMAAHGNGRLARQLVAAANRWREDRFFASKLESNSEPAPEFSSEAPSQPQSEESTHNLDQMAAFPFVEGDFNMERKLKTDKLKAKVEAKLANLVGMDGDPKDLIEEAQVTATFFEMSGDRAALEMCLNLVIYGNPGTGKTMFSRLYCM